MRILITGICGFAGYTIARGFRDFRPSWEIYGIDNLVRAGSELNRLSLKKMGVRFYHGDIRNFSDLQILPRCDWIVDAAANPSVLAGVNNLTSSRQLIEHNMLGTVQILEWARNNSAGLIILSTSRVYSICALSAIPMHVQGNRFVPDLKTPITGIGTEGVTEAFSTDPPLSLYGASKRASEILALEYANAFQLPVFINRCGVLAGPNQFGRGDQGIFSFWIHSWFRKRPLKYIGFGGSGFQVRDCLHARDLVPLLITQLENHRADIPRVLNVSGGLRQSASLRELSLWCEERFGPHIVDSEENNRPYDVPWLVLDANEAAKIWNWSPQVSLEDTWEEIAQHAQQNPDWLEITSG